jgi:type VI secretion system protein ImpK
MTPEFADAIDPVFVYALNVVDRLEKGEQLDPRGEQEQLCRRLEHADALLGDTQEWRLARYAIVAWIDEMLTDPRWHEWKDGVNWWKNNILERREFASSERATRFFQQASEATQFRDRNALEVYYICVILGFRGVYENPGENFGIIAEYNLPPSLENWLVDNAAGIRMGRYPSVEQAADEAPGAPPLEGHAQRAKAFLFFLFALAALLVVVVVRLVVNP